MEIEKGIGFVYVSADEFNLYSLPRWCDLLSVCALFGPNTRKYSILMEIFWKSVQFTWNWKYLTIHWKTAGIRWAAGFSYSTNLTSCCSICLIVFLRLGTRFSEFKWKSVRGFYFRISTHFRRQYVFVFALKWRNVMPMQSMHLLLKCSPSFRCLVSLPLSALQENSRTRMRRDSIFVTLNWKNRSSPIIFFHAFCDMTKRVQPRDSARWILRCTQEAFLQGNNHNFLQNEKWENGEDNKKWPKSMRCQKILFSLFVIWINSSACVFTHWFFSAMYTNSKLVGLCCEMIFSLFVWTQSCRSPNAFVSLCLWLGRKNRWALPITIKSLWGKGNLYDPKLSSTNMQLKFCSRR